MDEIVRSPSRDHLIKMKDGRLFKVSKSYKKALFQNCIYRNPEIITYHSLDIFLEFELLEKYPYGLIIFAANCL